MFFQGLVSSRSSNAPNTAASLNSPPGERKLQELFPARYEKIAGAVGWKGIHPGSLNLDVTRPPYEEVWSLKPAYQEPGDSVPYPAPYGPIPLERKEYRYYAGLLLRDDKCVEVLFRRPLIASTGLSSHNIWRFDVFAEVSLRLALGIDDKNVVRCITEDWSGSFPVVNA